MKEAWYIIVLVVLASCLFYFSQSIDCCAVDTNVCDPSISCSSHLDLPLQTNTTSRESQSRQPSQDSHFSHSRHSWEARSGRIFPNSTSKPYYSYPCFTQWTQSTSSRHQTCRLWSVLRNVVLLLLIFTTWFANANATSPRRFRLQAAAAMVVVLPCWRSFPFRYSIKRASLSLAKSV